MRKIILLSIFALIFSVSYSQSKITGGFNLNIEQSPWQVLLMSDGSYVCGGIIITPSYILTAKHCVDGVAHGSIKVVSGVTCKHEITSSNIHSVNQIILHSTLDVALLRLTNPISFNASQQAISIVESLTTSYYNIGNNVRVSGWGWLTPNGYDSSNCLQGVDVNILSNEAANQMLISSGQNPAITDNECATTGIGTIRQGACHGDSGGPLSIWDNQLNKNILLGIVSWGIPNCVGNNSNSPSVFVRVSMILNWIYSNILSISGPSTICDQAEYEIPTLPNGAIVEWSLAHTGSGAYPQLIQNTPEPNKCTIINPHRYPLTTTLTANIMINGTNVISLNKTVTSMGNSAVQYGHFFQQGCVVNGITQKTRSGSFSSDSYFYLNQGCLAEITLYDMAGRSVLFHSGYPPGYWSYNSSNSKLLVRPAVGSSGVPTSFKITGGCQDRSLMYFTYSLSEGSMTLSPNPASDFVTVSVNDSERGEFKLLDSDNLILESVSSLTSSYEIQLWNSSGLVKQVETDQPSYQLNLTGVPPGFYYVHVIKDGQTYRRQLVVQ